MKKPLLLFLVLIAIIIQMKGDFVDANQMFKEDQYLEEKVIIENLFTTRSILWNRVYNQEMNIDKWREELKKIVKKPLLDYDIGAFENLKKVPTDLDSVVHLEIVDIKNVVNKDDKITSIVKIKWTMQGNTCLYDEEISYSVILQKEGILWKLCDYKIEE
ncbi:hypothetical protein IZY60_08290 [Lutibacter sp. B2]|nr:hypothetical protein [Lutibacter sp. B2]